MKFIKEPLQSEWKNLIQRPVIQKEELDIQVMEIMNTVKTEGDKAIFDFSLKFDKAKISQTQVTLQEIEEAKLLIPEKLKNAIHLAKNNIEKFHRAQSISEAKIETIKGVSCWRKPIAIENVGFYIPGGSAPLFSTVLMLGIPASIAGCKEVILCTPTNKDGTINPIVLYTASLLNISKIFKVGGAQAIAALTYGTESIPRVDKIFGPGNQYVTKAKEFAQLQGVAIDMPAGPSEVLIIADHTSNPNFVASDLLSQSEHGIDSQVILLATSGKIIQRILTAIEEQLKQLPRNEIIKKALRYSKAILLNSINECIMFSNLYAPEHLIIATEDAEQYENQVLNAGSVFIGKYSCESAGDYASGTNHTLPTNGYAKNYSGVSLDSFVKKITFQKITKEGLKSIGPTIEIMAEAEQLMAHKNAVSIRLKQINNNESY